MHLHVKNAKSNEFNSKNDDNTTTLAVKNPKTT